MSEVNAFEESDRAARVRLEEEFARQIARGLELAGEVERLEAKMNACHELHEMRVAERDEAKAEVERLNDEIIEMRNLWGRDQRRAEKAEAEVERLQKTDAWEEVARQGIEIAALEDEVERLKAALEQIAATHDWHWGMDVARNALVEEVTAEDNSPR